MQSNSYGCKSKIIRTKYLSRSILQQFGVNPWNRKLHCININL